ncbi:hypothetical protein QBC40DRAFT_91759 [Triangularia verruculosa]|uniref:Secreted protein n=1 Tax=Triangularia verruculosa TaxID=2587418 RepID=A0AAN6XQE7_9PEZI|nr:hypothetical protein QBC40DRAFT_91759 [Triangularia verruculosa]
MMQHIRMIVCSLAWSQACQCLAPWGFLFHGSEVDLQQAVFCFSPASRRSPPFCLIRSLLPVARQPSVWLFFFVRCLAFVVE